MHEIQTELFVKVKKSPKFIFPSLHFTYFCHLLIKYLGIWYTRALQIFVHSLKVFNSGKTTFSIIFTTSEYIYVGGYVVAGHC